jgi:hypothetical protein
VAYPDPGVLGWVSALLDTEVTVLRGLRHGGSPWLLRAGDREVVLRVARAEQAAETATEVAAMTYAARVAGSTLRVAELLGYDLAQRTGYGLVLTARVPGDKRDPARLRHDPAPGDGARSGRSAGLGSGTLDGSPRCGPLAAWLNRRSDALAGNRGGPEVRLFRSLISGKNL